MTRKHYQRIAAALYEARMSATERRKLARIIAGVCATENPLFDATKFYQAAGCNDPLSKPPVRETK